MVQSIIENKKRKEIEKYLVQHRKATVNQIADHLNIHWITVQKKLDELESIGRLHKEKIGKTTIYYLNGVGKWQDKFKLNESTYLFADTFISPFGDPFIRLKETKKKEGNWTKFGEIMITKEKLNDVVTFLQKVRDELKNYNKVKEEVMKK